jgi:hypothetical protein
LPTSLRKEFFAKRCWQSGTLLGTYKGIDVTIYHSVNFTDDPIHPREGNDEDVSYTRYMGSYAADQAKGRLVCVFAENTIGLVKVTKVSEGASDYITMDLTVWQR